MLGNMKNKFFLNGIIYSFCVLFIKFVCLKHKIKIGILQIICQRNQRRI